MRGREIMLVRGEKNYRGEMGMGEEKAGYFKENICSFGSLSR
jgi:hypothetical protein